jgi:PKD repeat protein/photosystem II stability/assembly factor-like uncharacterized protein
MRKLTLTSLYLTLMFFAGLAQNSTQNDTANYPYWIEMMQDNDANFFQTQRAFNLYWEGREVTRGSGYKPFKRWENFMRTRVDSKGNRPKSDMVLNAYKTIDKTSALKNSTGNWELVGPLDLPNPETNQPNGMGRINAIAFHPTNPNTIYVGAPSGGFWRSTNNGETWETTTDRLPTLGVSAIVLNYQDPNIIYIGTGDRDAGDAPGLGVYKSFDGGTTWIQKNTGMGSITVNKMLIHPDYPDVIFAATENGVYKSIDGGENWTLKTSGTTKAMEFNPANPDVVYAVKATSFYRSTDNGESWAKTSSGLTSWSRAVIAVTPANPDFVYLLATDFQEFKAFYKSTNSGESFSTMSTTPNIMGWQSDGSDDGGQAWYDLCVVADPINPEVVYTGGVNIFKTNDGGTSWEINAHWVGSGAPAVHADHHDLVVNPLNNRIYTGNDGGIYYTDNGGTTWINISSGISISQIYKIGQSATKRDWVLCGNQDNGTSYFEDGTWSVILGGDGFECLFDYNEEKYVYGALYYGSISRSTNGGSFSKITSSINEEGAWLTPYLLNEGDPKIMYVGMKNIWRTTNCQSSSVSWSSISSELTSTSDFAVLENSPANPDILYAAREDKKLFRTDDASATSPSWSTLSNFPSSLITDIEAHPSNENIVYVTASNYQVYKSEDKGNSWTKITGNLPQVSINTIEYDKTSNEGLYVGTDVGIFYKDATMSNWIFYSDGFPATAEVSEIEIYYDNTNPENNVLRASTYGRGLWESPLYAEDITAENNARILEITAPKESYKPGDSIEASITIKNIGINTLDSALIIFQIDNAPFDTLNYYGAVNSTGVDEVVFPKFTSDPGNHQFTVQLIRANKTTISSQITSQYSVEELNLIQLNLVTDNVASETTWKFIDSDDNLLFESEAYVDDSIYNLTENFHFNTGCYKFIMLDVNGICCTNGDGLFTLSNLSTNATLGSGAEFNIGDTLEFCVDTFPTIDLNVSKTSIAIDEIITFENKTTDNGYTYVWNFGKDANPATYEGIEAPEVSYTSGGSKTISLAVSFNGNTSVKTFTDYVQVYDEPVIATQPTGVTLCPSDLLVLKTEATGHNIEYAWYFNNQILSEQQNSELRIENVQAYNEGEYYCQITNKYFEVRTDTVSVLLNALPELSVSASETEICSGSDVILTANGTGTFSWSDNLGDAAQVTVTPSQSVTYYVTLSNGICSTSKEISVLVAQTPQVTLQPENKRVCEGQSVTFLVQASGFGLNYQWQVNDSVYQNDGNMFYIDSVIKEQNGTITCSINNVCGSTSTNDVYLTVDPLPIAGFTANIDNATVTFQNDAEYADTYAWEFGDGVTSTMIEPTHTYEKGTWIPAQKVTNDCGTDTISMKVVIIPDGIDELNANEFLHIFPNPSYGLLNLELQLEAYEGTVEINLLNIEGKLIKQIQIEKSSLELSSPIDLSGLTKGIYQLSIKAGQRNFGRKLMIN